MDVSDPSREQTYYRPQCAELLIDAGSLVEPSGVLPHTLPVLAALGDLEAARRWFDESGALHTDESAAATVRTNRLPSEAHRPTDTARTPASDPVPRVARRRNRMMRRI
jgi:hypothetical protein